MAYEKLEDLPNEIRENLPEGGQRIFMAAFKSASSDGLNEQEATEVGWNSVRNIYVQGPDGRWQQKPEPNAGNPTGAMSGA